jgi:hypothetical protein
MMRGRSDRIGSAIAPAPVHPAARNFPGRCASPIFDCRHRPATRPHALLSPGSLSADDLIQLLSPSRRMNDPVKMRIGFSTIETRLDIRRPDRGIRFAHDSLVEREGFEPSVPRGDGIFETAPFELSGTGPSVRRAGLFARESKGSNPTSLRHS